MITAQSKPITMAPEHDVGADPPLTGTRRRLFVSALAALWGGNGRVLGVTACLALTAWAIHFEHLNDPALLPLFLFFVGLSLLSVVLPASGPRGQRVGLIPAVGLAAVMPLPPAVALLPLLLANTAYAFTRDMPLARRGVYERGVWLLLAMLAGGALHLVVHGPRPWDAPHYPVCLAVVALAYCAVYVGGRLFSLGRHFHAERTVRRHAWAGWRLEAVTLIVTAPVAVLMALAYSPLGVPGVAGAATLLALLLLVAHFGFEVALLREQVRAMEKISAVTVAQTSPHKVIERFLQVSADLVSCDRAGFWLTDDSETRLEQIVLAPSRAALPTGRSRKHPLRRGPGRAGRGRQEAPDRPRRRARPAPDCRRSSGRTRRPFPCCCCRWWRAMRPWAWRRWSGMRRGRSPGANCPACAPWRARRRRPSPMSARIKMSTTRR